MLCCTLVGWSTEKAHSQTPSMSKTKLDSGAIPAPVQHVSSVRAVNNRWSCCCIKLYGLWYLTQAKEVIVKFGIFLLVTVVCMWFGSECAWVSGLNYGIPTATDLDTIDFSQAREEYSSGTYGTCSTWKIANWFLFRLIKVNIGLCLWMHYPMEYGIALKRYTQKWVKKRVGLKEFPGKAVFGSEYGQRTS